MSVIPITSLTPNITPTLGQSIRAVVTLSWPYSSATRQCALLLADPDFRLRNRKGQVRVRFTGASAEAVAKSRIGIGDEVVLMLDGSAWEEDTEATRTPGRSVDGELYFRRKLGLRIVRDDSEIEVNVDAPASPPLRSPETSKNTAIMTPAPRGVIRLRNSLEGGVESLPSRTYASPAFAKRVRLSGEDYVHSAYDPFAEDGFDEKRRSFGDHIDWRYTAKTPSPTKATFEDADGSPVLKSSAMEQSASQIGANMLPPPLPRLDMRVGGSVSQQVVQHEQREGPTTPKLQPVQSPTLPLPSPFPGDSVQQLFGSQSPTMVLQSPSRTTRSKANGQSAAVSVLQDFNDDVPTQDRELIEVSSDMESGTDAEEEDTDQLTGQSQPVYDYTNDADADDEDMIRDSANFVHVEPPKQTHQPIDEPFHQPGARMNKDLVKDLTKLRDHRSPVVEPYTPVKHRTQVAAPGLFDGDGARSTPSSAQVTPQSDKDRVMQRTYRSLFGFDGASESKPTQPSAADEEIGNHKRVIELPELARQRLEAAVVSTSTQVESETDALSGYTDHTAVKEASQTFNEYSDRFAAIQDDDAVPQPPSSVRPSQFEVIELDSKSEFEDGDDLRDQEIDEPASVSFPALSTDVDLGRRNQDHLGDDASILDQSQVLLVDGEEREEEHGVSPQMLQQLPSQSAMRDNIETVGRDADLYESHKHSEAPVQSVPDVSQQTLASNSEGVTDRHSQLIDGTHQSASQFQFLLPEVQDSLEKPDAEDVLKATAEGRFQPVIQPELGPMTTRIAGNIANMEASGAVADDIVDKVALSHEAASSPEVRLIDSSLQRSDAVITSADDDIATDLHLNTKNSTIGQHTAESNGMLPQRTAVSAVIDLDSPSHVEAPGTSPTDLVDYPVLPKNDYHDIERNELQSAQTQSYPSLPLSPSNSQSILEMPVHAAQESVSHNTMTSVFPPTPQATQAESNSRLHEMIDEDQLTSQFSDVAQVAQREDGVVDQPEPANTKPARKSLDSRVSNIPNVIAAWFSPKRSSRIAAQTTQQQEMKYTTDETATTAAPTTVLERIHTNGISTAHSYFTPLSRLDELLNPSSQPAYGANTIDVLAIITDKTKEPTRAKRGPRDYYTIFRVADASISRGSSVRVEVFRPWKATLPVAEVGDIVLLRAFTVKSRKRQAYLLSTDGSAWCVWRYESAVAAHRNGNKPAWAHKAGEQYDNVVREEVKGPPVEMGDEERRLAKVLRSSWEAHSMADDDDDARDDEGGRAHDDRNGAAFSAQASQPIVAKL